MVDVTTMGTALTVTAVAVGVAGTLISTVFDCALAVSPRNACTAYVYVEPRVALESWYVVSVELVSETSAVKVVLLAPRNTR